MQTRTKDPREKIYLQNLKGIVKTREMTIAAKIEKDSDHKSIILFGSFRLTYKPAKEEYKNYQLHRLKQTSLTETRWTTMKGRPKEKILSLLHPFFIRGNNAYWLTTLHESAFEYLESYIKAFTDSDEWHFIRNEYFRFDGGRYTDGWKNGDKIIGKFLRDIINKEKMSVCLKMALWSSFTDVSMSGYLSFLRKYHITGDCGSLYPLVSEYYNFGQVCDGSNEWFVSRSKNFESELGPFTRGDIKRLRKASPLLVRVAVRYRGLELLLRLLRHSDTIRFPARVLAAIIESHAEMHARIYENTDFFAIIDKWLIHHSAVWRTQGYKKHLNEWGHYRTQLSHTLDWLRVEQPHIHKNQDWTAIWQLANAWRPQRQSKNAELKWPPVIHEPVMLNDTEFIELYSSESLYTEGDEMHHCVYSYSRYCFDGTYRVFQVKSSTERATLGISIKNGKFKFDQIYSYCNQHVSESLNKRAQQFIKQINNPLPN